MHINCCLNVYTVFYTSLYVNSLVTDLYMTNLWWILLRMELQKWDWRYSVIKYRTRSICRMPTISAYFKLIWSRINRILSFADVRPLNGRSSLLKIVTKWKPDDSCWCWCSHYEHDSCRRLQVACKFKKCRTRITNFSGDEFGGIECRSVYELWYY
jgi:hypothetical protein